MLKTKILAALIAVLLTTSAAADHMYVDTDTLYGWCSPYEIGDIGPGPLCAGYINAIVDTMAHGVSIHHLRACVSRTVDLKTLRNLIIDGLDKRPNGGHKNAHIWVAEVLARAYPCVPTNSH